LIEYITSQGLAAGVIYREYNYKSTIIRYTLKRAVSINGSACRLLVPKVVLKYRGSIILRGRIPSDSVIESFNHFIICFTSVNQADELIEYNGYYFIPAGEFEKYTHNGSYRLSLSCAKEERRRSHVRWDDYKNEKGLKTFQNEAPASI